MTTALMVVTDGRRDSYLDATVTSACEMLPWALFDLAVLVTDTPHVDRLRDRYGHLFEVVSTGSEHAGFAGTIQAGWRHLAGVDWLFHLEDDFTFNRPVPVDAMRRVLGLTPGLAQLALLRQAWNPSERAAGGIMQQHPGDYQQVTGWPGEMWFEHTRFFTTNPSLYPGAVMGCGWPDGPESEGHFTARLRDAGCRFGIWGDGTEWVTHIGMHRSGHGY